MHNKGSYAIAADGSGALPPQRFLIGSANRKTVIFRMLRAKQPNAQNSTACPDFSGFANAPDDTKPKFAKVMLSCRSTRVI